MDAFTPDQKMAMLVVPMLLFGMLGVSYASAAGRSFTLDEESTIKRAYAYHHGEGDRAVTSETLLRSAIASENFDSFVEALKDTPYHESATREVFDTLVEMYELHTHGKHSEASTELRNVLYGEGNLSV